MRHPTYQTCKPSGVEWIGDVPEHWEVKRLKYSAYRADEKVEADDENPIPYIGLEHIESRTGRILPLDPYLVPSGISNRFQAGDTLFGKLRPYLAKACNVEFAGLCSSELLVLRNIGQDRRFLLYSLLADGFISLVDASTYGAKMPRASWDFIGSCALPVPPIEEQHAIANFLDAETAKLDMLMAKKRVLIKKLMEKWSALVLRTVTKGLSPEAARAAGFDPHPKLEPSDIGWIGDIPKHWQIKRLGYLTSKVGSGKTPKGGAEMYQSEGVMLIRSQNVHDSGLRFADMVFISESVDEEMAGTRVIPGDVLLNITGASLGRCAIAPPDLPRSNVNQHVCIVRLQPSKALPEFVQREMTSLAVQSQIFSFENGSSREGLNFLQVRSLLLATPPLPEQRAIADYLDREVAKLDLMVTKMIMAISCLQEYRTSLISAAVTGKIDI